jgi:choline monooxygenase
LVDVVDVDDEGALAKAATLPASWYRGDDQLERERRAIFAREWLVAGPAASLADPGSYVATDVCGWPILLVVGDDGALRAFHNVCRHRAGPVAAPGEGTCRALVCGYHGWTYELDGRLQRARDFGAAADFDEADFGLFPVQVDRWGGMAWVNLDLSAPPLLDALGGLPEACADFDPAGLTYSHDRSVDLACNWKTYADNYMEGYHIPFVHPALHREVDSRQYRVEVADGYCRHTVPTRDGAVNSGTWLWRFPNIALNLYAEGMNVERFVPIGDRTTRIVYSYFFRDVSPASEEANARIVAMSTATLDEDIAICETVQRNLDGGVYEAGRLGPRHEAGVFHLHERVRAALARD